MAECDDYCKTLEIKTTDGKNITFEPSSKNYSRCINETDLLYGNTNCLKGSQIEFKADDSSTVMTGTVSSVVCKKNCKESILNNGLQNFTSFSDDPWHTYDYHDDLAWLPEDERSSRLHEMESNLTNTEIISRFEFNRED